jgi:hypothetical protein
MAIHYGFKVKAVEEGKVELERMAAGDYKRVC